MPVHPDASSVIKRAIADLSALVDEGAPASVIGAANHAIDCAKCGTQPARWAGHILLDYAHKRARQDRYTVAVAPGAPQ